MFMLRHGDLCNLRNLCLRLIYVFLESRLNLIQPSELSSICANALAHDLVATFMNYRECEIYGGSGRLLLYSFYHMPQYITTRSCRTPESAVLSDHEIDYTGFLKSFHSLNHCRFLPDLATCPQLSEVAHILLFFFCSRGRASVRDAVSFLTDVDVYHRMDELCPDSQEFNRLLSDSTRAGHTFYLGIAEQEHFTYLTHSRKICIHARGTALFSDHSC